QDNFLEYENIIIGAILIGSKWYKFYDDIKSQMFLYPPNQIIWKCIQKLKDSNIPISLVSVNMEIKLKYHQKDFPSEHSALYLSQCTSNVVTTAEATMQNYTLFLIKEYVKRRSIYAMQSSINKIIQEDDVPSRVLKICHDFTLRLETNSLVSFMDDN